MTTPTPQELLDLAAKVAARATDLLVDGARTARTQVESKSSATDMVTEVDRASEHLIVSELLAARPDDAIMAEEGSAREGTSGVRWVVDPLDGTTNFLYGYGSWAVSIAAETSSGVVAGVVADASRGEVFTAARGQGAFCDGERITCSGQDDLAQALVATGFAYAPARRRSQAQVLVQVLPEVRDIRRGGAASVDLCLVACGRVDAYYERGLAWWDHAAGSLVAREAGAVVEPVAGGPEEAGAIVAAAPGVAGPLQDLLGRSGA